MTLFSIMRLLLSFQYSQSACEILEPTISLRSREGSRSLDIVFSNQGSSTIEIFWMDYTGSEENMGSIRSKESQSYSTVENTAWRVKLLSGETISEVVASKGNESFPIESDCAIAGGLDLNTLELITFKSHKKYSLIADPSTLAALVMQSRCYEQGLEHWINKYVAAPGYHILCISSEPDGMIDIERKVSIEAWKDGYRSLNLNSGQTFVGSR
jgi:hypothetical protein